MTCGGVSSIISWLVAIVACSGCLLLLLVAVGVRGCRNVNERVLMGDVGEKSRLYPSEKGAMVKTFYGVSTSF